MTKVVVVKITMGMRTLFEVGFVTRSWKNVIKNPKAFMIDRTMNIVMSPETNWR